MSGTHDDFVADLERWAGEARVDDAVRARERERWLRRQAEEDASLLGLLVDLAERGTGARLDLSDDRVLAGRLVGVGADFVAVERGGNLTLVALTTIVAVEPDVAAAAGPAASSRAASMTATLVEVLHGVVADQPAVRLVAGGRTFAGRLVAAGQDVLSLAPDRRGTAMVYVAAGRVTEVVVER